MNEYDLPMFVKCGTCFGHGFLWVSDPSMIGLHRGEHRGKATCQVCGGKGGDDLSELELEEKK